uniref:LysM domain-containing protein n=1 Tax=Xiphophorus couchianus TaxID=32473 RepID=A0A3B5LEA3_9TELE
MEKKKPPGTVEFIVGPDDSINSIALKFNITPNKLVQLNKLFARSVYPGQVRGLKLSIWADLHRHYRLADYLLAVHCHYRNCLFPT